MMRHGPLQTLADVPAMSRAENFKNPETVVCERPEEGGQGGPPGGR